MSMGTYTLLWTRVLRSSLWIKGSKEARLLWITMLAMKDQNGLVFSSVVGLADAAKITPDECREALGFLLSPDADDTSKVAEGRRLREVPGGWEVINHEMYRFTTEAKRAAWAMYKAEQRAKQKAYIAGKVKGRAAVIKDAKNDGEIDGRKEAVGEAISKANRKGLG